MIGFYRFSQSLSFLDALVVTIALSWMIAFSWRRKMQKDPWVAIVSWLAALALFVGVGFIWGDLEETRPVFLLIPVGVFAFSRIRLFWNSKPPQVVACGFAALTICNYTSIALLANLPPFGMQNEDMRSAQEPGGQYTAVIVNRDGLTFSYDMLVLRPQALEVSTMLDRPDRTVIEFVLEGNVTGLKWMSPTSLQVLVVPGTEIVWQVKNWRGISIQVVDDPTAANRADPSVHG